MKKALIIGNYAVGNLGDDCLALATIQGLKETYPKVKLSLLLSPAADLSLSLIKNFDDMSLGQSFPAGIRSLLNSLFNGQLKKTLKLIRSTDVVIFGGGGLFNAEEAASIFIWGIQILVANFFKKPVILIGQSLPKTNLTNWRTFCAYVLNKAKLIVLRDPISYDVAKQLVSKRVTIAESTDLVFSLGEYIRPSKAKQQAGSQYLLINFRYYKVLPVKKLEEFACKLVSLLLAKSKYNLLFVPMAKEDQSFYETIKLKFSQNNRLSCVQPLDLEDLSNLYNQADGVVSMRLHGLIMAILWGKPALSLSYSDKNRGISQQIAMQDQEIDLQRNLSLNDLELMKLTDGFLAKVESGVSINQKNQDLIDKSWLNFTLCKDWLN